MQRAATWTRHHLATPIVVATLIAATIAPAAAFDDVEPGQFYTEAVEWMDVQEITTGTSELTFSPHRGVTRGEFVTFLWRMAGEPVPAGPPHTFADVAPGRFYSTPVAWAFSTAITTGRSATVFDPNAIVTRAEGLTFLWRYMCSPPESVPHPFDDVEEGTFFAEAVKWGKAAGITTGRTPTSFVPFATMSRAESATMMWRLAGEPAAASPGINRSTDAPACGPVVAGNQPPIAVDDTFATTESTPLAGNVLAANPTTADSDPDGDPIVVSASAPIAVDTDGSFVFDPTGLYETLDGGDTDAVVINYTIADPDGLTDDGTATITISGENDAPVLAFVGNRGVDALDELAFTATATDIEVPAQTLTFSLDGTVPTGASITSNGNFTWTPSVAQGNADYTFDVVVTDNGTPPLSDSETITVHVDPSNIAPDLASIGAQGGDELTVIAFTATATDADVPAQTLTFSLSGHPSGASISSTGDFTFTPTEAQGPGVYTFDVVVTDNGTPPLSDSETITVTVDEVNVDPTDGDEGSPATPAYATVGNTVLRVTGGSSSAPAGNLAEATSTTNLLTNAADSDLPAQTLTVVAATSATAQAGSVTTAADGTFVYTPAAGFAGVDSFTYSIVDGAGGSNSSTAYINVTGSVWYVDKTTGDDAAGSGTSDDPVASLTPLHTGGSLDASDGTGDTIYVANPASGTVTGPILLEDDQSLIGEGVALISGPHTLRPAGTAPTLSAPADVVALAKDNTVRGLDITATNGSAITGGDVDALTIADVGTVTSTNGTGIDLSGGTTVSVAVGTLSTTNSTSVDLDSHAAGSFSFGTINSNGGANGVLINALGTTTFNATGGTITNKTSRGLDVNGGSGAITFGASLHTSTGRSVEVTNRSGGTVTVSGAIDDNAQGVSLSSNTGTFNFTATLDIDTVGAHAGFSAVNSGTISSTGSINSVDTSGGTGIAVRIDDTTIGAAGVVWRDVSAAGAATGILLDNSGTGAFVVTGVGASVSTTRGPTGALGTGGTITGTTGDAITLVAAANVTLRSMILGDPLASVGEAPDAVSLAGADGLNMTGTNNVVVENLHIARTEDFGVFGENVNGFTMRNSQVLNAGDANEEGAIRFGNEVGQTAGGLSGDRPGLFGTSVIADSILDGFYETGLEINNQSGSLTLTVDDVGFQENDAANGEEGVLLIGRGTSTMTVLVDNSTFEGLRAQGVDAVPQGTATLDLTVRNSTFTDLDAADGSVKFNPFTTGDTSLTVHHNTFVDVDHGLFVKLDADTDSDVTVTNNTFGTAGVVGSGPTGNAIELIKDNAANGDLRVRVANNLGHSAGVYALAMRLRETIASGPVGFTDVTITDNSMVAADGGGFWFNSGFEVAVTDHSEACVHIAGNTSNGELGLIEAFQLTRDDSAFLGLPGLAATATEATVENHLMTTNANTDSGGVGAEVSLNGGTTGSVGPSCALPVATPTP